MRKHVFIWSVRTIKIPVPTTGIHKAEYIIENIK